MLFRPSSRRINSAVLASFALEPRQLLQAMRNLVVVPICPGFARSAIDLPERGLYGLYFGDVGQCSAVNFRDAGIAVATINQWVIDHMMRQNEVLPKGIIVVGQSGGG